MAKTDRQDAEDAPAATPRKKRGWHRRSALRPGETIEALEAEANRLREEAARKLVRTAGRVGFFGVVVSRARLEAALKAAMGQDQAPASRPRPPRTTKLGALEARIALIQHIASKETRRLGARRKILMGSFLIAQVAHRPQLHADLRDALARHLDRHPDAEMQVANRLLLADWLGPTPPKPARRRERQPTGDPSKAAVRRNAHRKILLGSFLIAWIEEDPALTLWVRPELAKFLDQHPDPEVRAANRALLVQWLDTVAVAPEDTRDRTPIATGARHRRTEPQSGR